MDQVNKIHKVMIKNQKVKEKEFNQQNTLLKQKDKTDDVTVLIPSQQIRLMI